MPSPFPPAIEEATLFGRPAFEVRRPERPSLPLVLNSPHSGACYPQAFLDASRLDARTIRRSEDFFVDDLIAPAAVACPLLKANFPRAWLDVNREPYELDPKMFSAPLPAHANVRSMRVAGGLGTIPRIVAEGQDIYAAPLSVEEGLSRIEQVYRPYHRTLRRLVTETRDAFGIAVLLDCHSMPASVRGPHSRSRPDIVLGDRYGSSCASDLTDFVARALTRMGYAVSRNKPYAGGYITEHYGEPGNGIHAVQIEFNRSLYVDERSLEKRPGFDRLSADLVRLVEALGEAFDAGFLARPEAAE